MRRDLPGMFDPRALETGIGSPKNRGFEPILAHGIAVALSLAERHAPDVETKVDALPETVTATPREKPQN
jgi:hypothetical protein